MKIRRHYLVLRGMFPGVGEGQPIETTLTELAEALDCTHRNVVFVLGRMRGEGWLQWTPRRGRGNRSQLVFVIPADALRLEEAKELAQRSDLKSALQLLQPGGTALLEPFQDWLTGQFGFHSEMQNTRRMDTLRFPLPGTIQSLDPARIHYFGESHLVNQLFDSLLRMDAKGETPLPHLAHAWESNKDRTEWILYLRKGVQFHHGRVMTASDVIYSLKRLGRMAPAGLYSWVYNGIQHMEKADDTTVVIKLKERNEAFLSFLTTNRASIVPRDICEAEGERFGHQESGGSVIGTGPFRLLPSEHGIWSLEAFSNYFLGRAFLDRVEVWAMPGSEAREMDPFGASSDSGEPSRIKTSTDLMGKIAETSEQKTSVEESNQQEASTSPGQERRQYQVMHNVRMSDHAAGEWQQVRQSGTTCKYLTVNESKDGPLSSIEARQALNALIDRKQLLALLSGDVIEAASSFWGESDSLEESNENNDEYWKKRSKALFGTTPLKLVTIPQYGSDARLLRRLLASQGIALDIETIPAAQFKGTARMSADLLLFSIMLDEHRELRLVDLFTSMGQHMLSESRLATEGMVSSILKEEDSSVRREKFIELEKWLTARGNLMFLYRKHLKTAFHPSVRGIALESLSWVRFRDLWFR
ncbi:ABC transporter substrate-binding protein [Paenibacillus sp. CAU 1782]